MSRLLRGIAAGLGGTSWMTAVQELAASDDGGEQSWDDAPTRWVAERTGRGGEAWALPAAFRRVS